MNDQSTQTHKNHHVSNLRRVVTLLPIVYNTTPCKVYIEIVIFIGVPNGSPKTIKLWILQLWGFITFPFLFQIEKFQKKIYGLSKEFFTNIIFFQSKVIWFLKLSFIIYMVGNHFDNLIPNYSNNGHSLCYRSIFWEYNFSLLYYSLRHFQ